MASQNFPVQVSRGLQIHQSDSNSKGATITNRIFIYQCLTVFATLKNSINQLQEHTLKRCGGTVLTTAPHSLASQVCDNSLTSAKHLWYLTEYAIGV